MLHQFRLVFQRNWNDDWEAGASIRSALLANRGSVPAALVEQLRAEIDGYLTFRGRFEFSNSALFLDETYYLVGQIFWEGDDDVAVAWDAFREAFQVVYDECGVAGHYQIVPFPLQTALQERIAASDDNFPVPPWRTRTPAVS